MKERVFEASVLKDLRAMFPGCVILKNEAGYMQGVPDRTILFNHHWAVIEIKASESAAFQPNQEYYVGLLDGMGFAAVIYPSNKEQVYDGLQQALTPSGCSCDPRTQ